MRRHKKIEDAEYKLISDALPVVFNLVAAARAASSITITKRESWNPDAHINITITAKEVFAALDVIDSFRHLQKLKTEGGSIL